MGTRFQGTRATEPAGALYASTGPATESLAVGAGGGPLAGGRASDSEARLAGELGDALASDGLSLFYQPVVSLDSGAVLAVEALVRWERPNDGLMLGGRLISIAEHAGLVADLDRWVVDGACRQVQRWSEVHGESGVPRICVNLSSDRLADPRLVPEMSASLRRWSVRPGQLVVELGETPVLLTLPGAARLGELQSLGVRVLLDDFGTGHASLFAIRRLFVDGIKVDRSFVEQVAPRGGAVKVLEAMQRSSEGMGVDLVVTGVETAAQLAELRAVGIRAAQGLLLLGPVPPETLMEVFDLSRPRLGPIGAGFSDPRPARATDEPTVTLSRAAAMLQISPATLRRWADDGRVEALRSRGGHRRFRPSDLRRLAGPRAPRVRVPPMPSGPLAAVSELLAAEGSAIAVAAGRALYEGEPGWFGGRRPSPRWTSGHRR